MIKTILVFLSILFIFSNHSYACTSAIVGASLNPSGRPLLWKLRDTDTTDNKIEYVKGEDGEFSYVGLFNAKDKKLEEVWMGMNETGFAIMNTASYNIKNDNIDASKMDKEGVIMNLALKHCETVDDFSQLLDSLPKPLGVEANFGVIDAWGNGAYFETNNYEYVRFNLEDSENDILVRTNYSHSGRKDEGYGFIREANANHLLNPAILEKNVTPQLLTECLSRSFWHDLMKKDMLEENETWIIDQDFMPRYKSTATIVIEGCKPLEKDERPTKNFIENQYIMWTGMGYPPCSEIIPVWCKQDGVDSKLRGSLENGHCVMGDLVRKRRDEVFRGKKGNKDKYIYTPALKNKEGTGYLQILIPQNLEVYKKISEKRDEIATLSN